MNNRISYIFLLVFAVACKEQEQTPAQPGPNDPVISKAIPVPDMVPVNSGGDPYFQVTDEIISPQGPFTITRSALQDKNGDMWFATWQGIVRYDGKMFTNVTLKENLVRWHAFTLLQDSKYNIWIGMIGGGVYRYDGKTYELFTSANGLVNDMVECIMEDHFGNIWFGTEFGVSCYNGRTFNNFTTENGLCENSVNSIVEDSNGKIWIATRGGVSCYDGEKFSNFLAANGKPFSNVRSMIEDRNGRIWIGGSDGLVRYTPTTTAPVSVSSSYTTFSNNFIGYIHEDKAGNLLLSEGGPTGMSLRKIDHASAQSAPTPFTTLYANDAGQQFMNQVFGIMEDKDGRIWFGTATGVMRFDPVTKEVEDFAVNSYKD